MACLNFLNLTNLFHAYLHPDIIAFAEDAIYCDYVIFHKGKIAHKQKYYSEDKFNISFLCYGLIGNVKNKTYSWGKLFNGVKRRERNIYY